MLCYQIGKRGRWQVFIALYKPSTKSCSHLQAPFLVAANYSRLKPASLYGHLKTKKVPLCLELLYMNPWCRAAHSSRSHSVAQHLLHHVLGGIRYWNSDRKTQLQGVLEESGFHNKTIFSNQIRG